MRLFLLLLCCMPLAALPYESAHVVFICHDSSREMILFGLTTSGKLSTFGGMREPCESDPRETAARELEEEALGVLGSRNQVRPLLKQGVWLSTPSPNFFLKSEVNPGSAIAAYRIKRAAPLSKVQKEMVDIVAVEVDGLKAQMRQGFPLLFPDNQGFLRPLRTPVAKMALKTYF